MHTTRRDLLGRVGLLAATVLTAFGLWSDPLVAKKKKKSKGKNKKKQKDDPLNAEDWLGSWNTTLSNGVKGIATFSEFDPFSVTLAGTYTNSVGSGQFNCAFGGDFGASLHCIYEQGDGETGGFSISLTGKNNWFGSYFIDGGGSGTWAGVRR